jgi:branched-chain amino acid transport system substrate-binding protein
MKTVTRHHVFAVKTVTRRHFLAATAAGATGLLSAPTRGTAQGKEIVMLGIWPFTGPFADVGPLLDRGMRLAIEEWGNKVIGRPIKYITRDDETKASSATRRMEEAIDSEGVKVVIGPWSSGVALACTEVAKRRKVFYYFSGGTEEIAGKRCHRYGFNWAASPYTAMHVVVDNYMKLNPGHKKWYLFVSDYAFGWSVEKYTREAGQRLGIEFVGADRMPLGTREYSGFVSKAAAAKPDVLCLLNAGQDVIVSIREAHNFGLAPKVAIVNSWGVGTEDFLQLDAKTRENMWVGTNAYYGVNTPVAKRMAEMYQAKHNAPPGYAPCAAYGMTRLTLRAIEKANSAEPADIVRALEGWDTQDWPGRVWVNPKTHQTVRDYFLLRCKKPDQMKHQFDFADIVAVSNQPLMPDSMNECKDIGQV